MDEDDKEEEKYRSCGDVSLGALLLLPFFALALMTATGGVGGLEECLAPPLLSLLFLLPPLTFLIIARDGGGGGGGGGGVDIVAIVTFIIVFASGVEIEFEALLLVPEEVEQPPATDLSLGVGGGTLL